MNTLNLIDLEKTDQCYYYYSRVNSENIRLPEFTLEDLTGRDTRSSMLTTQTQQ